MRRSGLIPLLLLAAGIAAAAVDSRDKRASAANAGGTALILPNPDGTISAADRAMLAGEYSGLAAAEPEPEPEPGEGKKRPKLTIGVPIGT